MITVRAQHDEYLWDWTDLAGWPLWSIAGGLGGGVAQGLIDDDSVGPALRGATAFGVFGAGIGYAIGAATGEHDRDRWAGLVVGLGAGIAAGWAVGTLVSGGVEEERVPVTFAFRLPLGR